MSLGVSADSSLEGIRYYFQRARLLSFDEASNVLATELSKDLSFELAWREAKKLYPLKRLYGGDVMEEQCYLAVIAYTLERPNVCKEFNALCRAAEANPSSWEQFRFKSLWFFLIRAFEQLPPFSAGSLFRGVKTFHEKLDGSVSFEQFVSASTNEDVASRFGRWGHVLTLHGVPAELVRDIGRYSIYPHHCEVLIWPFCEFRAVSAEGKKELQFVCAKPWVGRKQHVTLITTSLLGAAPVTLLDVPSPKAAKTATDVPGMDSSAPCNEKFPPEDLAHSTQIMQPGVITDANNALPEVHVTSSKRISLSQATCTLRGAAKLSITNDKMPERPGSPSMKRRLESAVAQVTSSFESAVLSPLSNAAPTVAAKLGKFDISMITMSKLPDMLPAPNKQDSVKSVASAMSKNQKSSMDISSAAKFPSAMCKYLLLLSPEAAQTCQDVENPSATLELPPPSQPDQPMKKDANPSATVDMSLKPQAVCTIDAPLPQSDLVMAKIFKNTTLLDLAEPPTAIPTADLLVARRNHVILATKTSEATNMPEAPSTSSKKESPLPQSNHVAAKTIKPVVVMDMLETPVISATTKFMLSQNDQGVVNNMVTDMPGTPGTPSTKYSVPNADQVTAKIVWTNLVTGVSKPPDAPSIMQPPLPETNQMTPKNSEPGVTMCLPVAMEAYSTTEYRPPLNEWMPEMMISVICGMSPNIAECPVAYHDEMTREDLEHSNIVDPHQTPNIFCTTGNHHPKSNQIMPKITKPGLFNEVPETPETSCTFKSSLPHDYSVHKVLKPTAVAGEPTKSSHMKSSLPRTSDMMSSTLTVGKVPKVSSAPYGCPWLQADQMNLEAPKQHGTTVVAKDLAPPLSLDNASTMNHVLVKLETLNYPSGLTASLLFKRSPGTVTPPIMVWPLSSNAVIDEQMSIFIDLVPARVLICNNQPKPVEASGIALLIFFCIIMVCVMMAVFFFLFAK